MTDEELQEIAERLGELDSEVDDTFQWPEDGSLNAVTVALDYLKDGKAMLAEIERQRAEIAALTAHLGEMDTEMDTEMFDWSLRMRGLENDNEILQAKNAAMREIVQWVADVPWYLDSSTGYTCAGCDRQGSHPATIQHRPDCPVTQARAWLAEHPSPAPSQRPNPFGNPKLRETHE